MGISLVGTSVKPASSCHPTPRVSLSSQDFLLTKTQEFFESFFSTLFNSFIEKGKTLVKKLKTVNEDAKTMPPLFQMQPLHCC